MTDNPVRVIPYTAHAAAPTIHDPATRIMMGIPYHTTNPIRVVKPAPKTMPFSADHASAERSIHRCGVSRSRCTIGTR